MPPRTTINNYPGTNVTSGNSVVTAVGQAPLPAGRTIRITCFGGALTHEGRVELQIRTQVTPTERWRTLRCVIGPGHGHYENFSPIVGDGTIAALRIERFNDDAATQKPKAWIEGFRSRG